MNRATLNRAYTFFDIFLSIVFGVPQACDVRRVYFFAFVSSLLGKWVVRNKLEALTVFQCSVCTHRKCMPIASSISFSLSWFLTQQDSSSLACVHLRYCRNEPGGASWGICRDSACLTFSRGAKTDRNGRLLLGLTSPHDPIFGS